MAPLPGGNGPPPLPASSSPPFSSLSPLAPPFTVSPHPPSRRFPSNLERNSAHLASPTPQTSRPYIAPSNIPDWSSPSLAPHQLQSLLDTSPCYPRYSLPIDGLTAADPFDYLPEMGPWRAATDGQEGSKGAAGAEVVSPWMELSLDFNISSFQEGGTTDRLISYQNSSDVWHGKDSNLFTREVIVGSECSETLHNGIPKNSEVNTIAPCHISCASVLDPSPLDEGMLYSPIPTSFSSIESRNKSHSNSYDGYMAYPANTRSTSAQLHAPSSRGSSLVGDYSILNHVYPAVLDIDSYNSNDYCGDHVSSSPKECDISKKEGYDKVSRKDNVEEYNHTPAGPFSLKSGLFSGNGLTTWDSMETSKEAKSVFKLKGLNLPNAFVPEIGPAEENDYAGSSSQTFEQLSLAVDSPCWKGVKGSQQFLHAFTEIEGICPESIEPKECGDLSAGYSETLPSSEQVGTLILDKNNKTSEVSYLREPISVSLPCMQQNFEDADKGVLDCCKDVEKGLHFSGVCKEQGNEVRKEQTVDSEATVIDVIRSGKEDCAFCADHLTTGDGIANLVNDLKPAVQDNLSDVNPRGKSSPNESWRRLLVMTIHTLSETLLSSYDGCATELKEQDYELLQSVIHNIGALSLSTKKATQSQGTRLTVDAIMNNYKNNRTHEMKRKMHSLGFSTNSSSTKFNGMPQAIEKVFDGTVLDPEENPQAVVYKNLWIEAEAALCTKKYELQLLHMKVEMEDQKNKAKGRSQQVNSLASLKSTRLEEHQSLMKSKERLPNNDVISSSLDLRMASNRKPPEVPSSTKTGEVDASVLARYRVMNGHVYKSGPTSDGKSILAGLDDAEASVGAEVAASITSSECNGEPEHLPTKLADLGFMESGPRPDTNDHAQDKGKPEVIRIKLHDESLVEAFASGLSGNFRGAVLKNQQLRPKH